MAGSETVREYKLGRELGRGGFGVVFEALNTRTGSSCAVKRLSLAGLPAAELPSIQAEVALLRRLHHPNIVRYIDSIKTREYLFIVLELVEGGSLAAAVKRFGPLSERLTAIYASQILVGLRFLHEQGVIHRCVWLPRAAARPNACVCPRVPACWCAPSPPPPQRHQSRQHPDDQGWLRQTDRLWRVGGQRGRRR